MKNINLIKSLIIIKIINKKGLNLYKILNLIIMLSLKIKIASNKKIMEMRLLINKNNCKKILDLSLKISQKAKIDWYNIMKK